MAYVRNPLKQDDGEQAQGVIGTDGQSITGDQASAKPVSNWTNLNNCITGNQGAGSQISDKMLEQGNKDVTAANIAGSNFAEQAGKQINDNTKKDNGWSDFFKTADLSKATDQQKNDFNTWKAQPNYGGPQDVASASGYGDMQKAVNTAKDSAARSYTQDSQFGLAKDSLGKGNQNYNGGMSMLDTILARQAGGGQKIDDFNANNSADKINERAKVHTDMVNNKINEAKLAGDTATKNVNDASRAKLDKTVGFIADREADNKASGDNAYVTDHSLADYASNEELVALDNLINGFGVDASGYDVNDLLNKSGADNTTVGQANVSNQYGSDSVDNGSGESLGYVWDPITQQQKVIGSAITKRRPI